MALPRNIAGGNKDGDKKSPRGASNPFVTGGKDDDELLPSKLPDFDSPHTQRLSRAPSSFTEDLNVEDKSLNVSKRGFTHQQNVNEYPSGEDDDVFSTIDDSEMDDNFEDDGSGYADEDDEEYHANVRENINAKKFQKEQQRRAERYDDFEDEPDDEEVYEAPPEPVKLSRKEKRQQKKSAKKVKKGNRKDSKGQDVFVKDNDTKLDVFGGSKRSRKLKEHHFDDRQNLARRRKLIRNTTLGIIILSMGLGIKGCIDKPDTLSQAQVSQIAKTAIGVTDFPLVQGQGFAKDFMQAYLTVAPEGPKAAETSRILGYYYDGSLSNDSGTGNETKIAGGNYAQEIAFGPTVYKSEALTDHSARYVIGAVTKVAGADAKGPNSAGGLQWQFFNVNVYYDSDSGSFMIAPGSPTVVPATEVGDKSKLPEGEPLGNGEAAEPEVSDNIQSVVYGFIRGFAVSSPTDHSQLDQYVVSDPPASLLKGLDSTYALAGEISNAVTYEAFMTDDSNVLKVDVTVTWRQVPDSDVPSDNVNGKAVPDSVNHVDWESSYVMTLQKQSNGQWLVSDFSPKFFQKKLEDSGVESEPTEG